MLAGGEYPWTDIYQAYHRLLLYHEHTDGPDNAFDGSRENTQRITKPSRQKSGRWLTTPRFFSDRAWQNALDRLAGLIATQAERSVIVFNPLDHPRTDLVRIAAKDLGTVFALIDAATQQTVPFQRDGEELCFVAADVPSLGYKTFRVVAGSRGNSSARNNDAPPTACWKIVSTAFDSTRRPARSPAFSTSS